MIRGYIGIGGLLVVIRLSRRGMIREAKYRITVCDSRTKNTGRFLEIVGFYNANPRGKEEGLSVKQDRVDHWLSVGAQMSDRVKRILKK